MTHYSGRSDTNIIGDNDNGVGVLTLQNSPPGATSVSFPLAGLSCSGTGQLNSCC